MYPSILVPVAALRYSNISPTFRSPITGTTVPSIFNLGSRVRVVSNSPDDGGVANRRNGHHENLMLINL